MASAEERQVSIFLRKYNLEEIEKVLKAYHLASPDLEEDERQQAEDTLNVLIKVRSINADINLVKEANGRLSAKRISLQRECNEIINATKKTLEEQTQLKQTLTEGDIDSNFHMSQHNVELQEILNEFRHNGYVYDEKIMTTETEKAFKILSDEMAGVKILQNEFNEVKKMLDNMNADVPNNILDIVGEMALKKKLNSLTNRRERHLKYI